MLGLGEEGIQPTKKRRLPRVSMSGSVEPRNKRGVCEIWMLSKFTATIVEEKQDSTLNKAIKAVRGWFFLRHFR